MDIGDIKEIHPPTLGWLEKKLTQKELDYVWKCVGNKIKTKHSSSRLGKFIDVERGLDGDADSTYDLVDLEEWFFHNTLDPLIKIYQKEFKSTNNSLSYGLEQWWVNYQHQNEFIPLHLHYSVYSFVIWLKFPTDYETQKKYVLDKGLDGDVVSSFQFSYRDILGDPLVYNYPMRSESEGILLFFPSKCVHQVYPFYNCKGQRISVSGNISIRSKNAVTSLILSKIYS